MGNSSISAPCLSHFHRASHRVFCPNIDLSQRTGLRDKTNAFVLRLLVMTRAIMQTEQRDHAAVLFLLQHGAESALVDELPLVMVRGW